MGIETKNLSYYYDTGTKSKIFALDEVNFSAQKGEIIGVIGQTGSGKSTFAQLLNGLIKPSEGQIFLDGKNAWEEFADIRDIHFKVGLTFQYPENQLFKDTVYEDIAYGPRNKGFDEKTVDELVLSSVQFVGLDEKNLQRSPFDLSGGERRRAAIAGIIAMDPEILILDEPTSGLDPIGKEQIINAILKYHKNKKNIVIFISHIMEDIARISDKVLVLDKGKVVMYDDPEEVFAHKEKLREIGLDIPQITRIMESVDRKFGKNGRCITNVDEAVEYVLKNIKEKDV